MKITVIKMNDANQVAVRAEQVTTDFQEFLTFATKLGVQQDFEALTLDFMSGSDRTYIISLAD